MKGFVDTLAALGLVVGNTPEVETLQVLSNKLESYRAGFISSQKEMVTEMNDQMMQAFGDSQAMYSDMLARIAAQYAAINQNPPLAPAADVLMPPSVQKAS